MGIARKPSRREPTEEAVQTVIGKGGHPAGGGEDRKARKVLLRVPVPLLGRVDAAAAARPLPTTRTAWLLEAIHEKLTRDALPHG